MHRDPATDRLLAERLEAQLLTGRTARSPEDVAGRLLAVQAQDPRAARLAVRSRSAGLHATDVDRALTVDRTLVVGWLNRWTLHLVLAEDYWWLHALTAPQTLTSSARRLAQEGVAAATAQRATATLRRVLEAEGPLTRESITDRLAAAGVPTAGQAVVHLLRLAGAHGILVRGPVVAAATSSGSATGYEQAYVLADDWLPPRVHVDRGVALARLAERYLAGHGPADDRDLARWAGIPLGSARAGLRAVAGSLVERADGRVALPRSEPERALPTPRLLGAFDPALLGWRSREEILGRHAGAVVSGGVLRAFALVRGRAAGRWQVAGRRVVVTPFEDSAEHASRPGALTAAEVAALDADAADVERFLGLGVSPPG